MGVDITSFVEVRDDGGWRTVPGDGWSPFDWRDYGLYGFLADVRNHSHVPVIAEPRGVPDDCSPVVRAVHDGDEPDGFSASWSARDELRMVVLARLQEIRDIEELMRPAVTGSNHSGKGSVRAVPKGRTL